MLRMLQACGYWTNANKFWTIINAKFFSHVCLTTRVSHTAKSIPNPTRTILTLAHDFKISVDSTFIQEKTKRAEKAIV